MSEAQVTDAPSPLETQGASSSVSAGALLRQARERAGLHIAALAVALKIPTRKLEALESDRYDELPDAVFIRALALSVCRHLKLDPEPILSSLPQTNKPRLVPDEAGMKVPFERPGHVTGAAAFWGQVPRPALIAALVLLVGAVVVVLLPEDALHALSSPATVTAPEPAVAEATSAPPVSPVPVLPAPELTSSSAAVVPPAATPAPAVREASAAPTASSVPPVTPAVSASVVVAPGTVSASASTPRPATVAAVALTPSPVAAVTSADNVAGRQVVQFKTRATSWVEVVDATGTVLLRRNLEAGESVGVSGTLPLAVVVGRVDATEVLVRGKPFALQGLSNDNVARFEVKP